MAGFKEYSGYFREDLSSAWKSRRFLIMFIAAVMFITPVMSSEKINIKSARLYFEIESSKIPGKEIFINGRKAGEAPVNKGSEAEKVSVSIAGDAVSAIATVNIINIENKPLNSKISNGPKDAFKIKNIYLEIIDGNGNAIESDIGEGPFLSFKTGVVDLSKKEYTYTGSPLPEIRLVLPSDKTGYIRQAFFDNRTGELYRDNARKKWQGLDAVALSGPKRTMCDFRPQELAFHSKEYMLDMMARYNSDIILLCYPQSSILEGQKDKIKFLRQHEIKINLMYGKIGADSLLPESDGYKDFFKNLSGWAPLIDMVGMDEWFLSPAILKTDGGQITPITGKFLEAFAKYSGYSPEDAKWAFKNHTSDDPRALKAWEFCGKVQNDFAREFVRAAKKANPQIKTWVSYITKNWNKYVTCIDSAVNGFDEILECQTYWYGRGAQDSLNSPLITAPIGIGKIFKAEYPDKFLWTGIDPRYTGGKDDKKDEKSWGNFFYHNTPEEVVPYLALLYAVSDGVFIQNWEGAGLLNYGLGLGIDGNFIDRFADVVNLVSKTVPFIKSYKKSDIAYYYDPAADWEIVRRVYSFVGSRETNEIAIGLLLQFCDIDVTADIGKYENVVYAGMLLPAKFDYARQNVYLMFAPEYDENGNKIPESQLIEKLGIKGFEPMGRNFFPSDGFNENGSKDLVKISGLSKETLSSGKIIRGASYPARKASYSDSNDYFLIGAHNKDGNVLLNSLWPSFTQQDAAKKIIMKDLDYFGWTKRDCPQVNGTDKIVAVAFREPRTAVLDFGKDASFNKINILMFNGREGIIRNETVKYGRGMKIDLPPLNVLVVYGVK